MGMNFRSISWSIACTLLMVLWANAQTSPTATVRSECPAKTIESRLESIEDRLEGIEKIVSTLSNPSIQENCTVDLASYGLDDSPRNGYVRTNGGSSEDVLRPGDATINRGVTLFDLDPKTCMTKNRQRFDTYASVNDTLQCVETLESAAADTIIIGVTADSIQNAPLFEHSAGPFFAKYNINLTELKHRDKFAFIMQKGYPKKTIFERKPRYGESLFMEIVVRVSAISEVTFSRV